MDVIREVWRGKTFGKRLIYNKLLPAWIFKSFTKCRKRGQKSTQTAICEICNDEIQF